MAKIAFTATAGTGAALMTDGANASASICPAGADTDKNWVLPLSGTANNGTSGSFYNLLSKYGAETGQSGATNIVKLPLAFVRSGYVSLYRGRLLNTGYEGGVWSRTAGSATSAYYLFSNPTYVNPSYDGDRYYGFPLRCLYPGK